MKNENLRKFKRFIVADKDGRPMAFEKDQFCYCSDSNWQDEAWPVKTYTWARAHKLMALSNKFRTDSNMEPNRFKLYPFKK